MASLPDFLSALSLSFGLIARLWGEVMDSFEVIVEVTPASGTWAEARKTICEVLKNPIGDMKFIVKDVFKSADKNVSFENSTNHFGNGNQIVNHHHGKEYSRK